MKKVVKQGKKSWRHRKRYIPQAGMYINAHEHFTSRLPPKWLEPKVGNRPGQWSIGPGSAGTTYNILYSLYVCIQSSTCNFFAWKSIHLFCGVEILSEIKLVLYCRSIPEYFLTRSHTYQRLSDLQNIMYKMVAQIGVWNGKVCLHFLKQGTF